jgi:hypothetical protein
VNRDAPVSPVILISDDDPRLVRALSQQVNRAGAWAVPTHVEVMERASVLRFLDKKMSDVSAV